jgi:hypothetical protein
MRREIGGQRERAMSSGARRLLGDRGDVAGKEALALYIGRSKTNWRYFFGLRNVVPVHDVFSLTTNVVRNRFLKG